MVSMHAISSPESARIAQDLQIRKVQVETVVHLLDEGNSVPFIARYRREQTGGLREEQLRQVQLRVNFLRQLHDRKQTILKHVENQGRLSDGLREAILEADTTRRLDDLYLPYKTKKRGPGAAARDKGLEPLALAIWYGDPAANALDELLPTLVNPDKQLNTPDEVRAGLQHLLAEIIAESADVRAPLRGLLWETSKVVASKHEKLPEGHGLEYKDYFQFTESARQIPPHRILALNRGEKEHALQIRLEYPRDKVEETGLGALADLLLSKFGETPPPPRPRPAPAAPRAPAAMAPAATTAVATATPSANGEAAPVVPVAPEVGGASIEATIAVGEAASAPSATDMPAPAPEESAPPPESVASTVESAQAVAVAEEEAPPAMPEPTPAQAPAAEVAPLVAPLVASMTPQAAPQMTGEPLSPHVPFTTPHVALLKAALDDALARLLLPSLEREIRHELTDEAEAHAVAVFARNLRSLLMQPPLRNRRVLAFDPSLRAGSKLAALDEHGNLLEHATVYPLGPPPARRGRERGAKGQTAPQAAAAQAAPAAQGTPPASETSGAVPMPAAPAESAPGAEAAATPVVPPPPVETPHAETAHGEASPAETPPAAAVQPPVQPPVQVVSGVATTTTPDPELAVPVPAPGATEAQPAAAEAASTGAASTEAPQAIAPPEPTVDRKAETKGKIKELIAKHKIDIIALGNGAGCREVEELVAELIGSDLPEVSYALVSEAGASVYALSPLAREELPAHDVALRSAVSIGRRLQDPLAELVKIDPQHVGVGLYQHDMSRKDLKESLDAVVLSCVNQVGVDVNSAGVALLRHVAGLNPMAARDLVEHRKQHGPFTSREQYQQLPSLAGNRATQAAGFMRIPQAPNPLDRTWIHPEKYGLAERVLAEAGYTVASLDDAASADELRGKLQALNVDDTARKLDVAPGTVADLIDDLLRPGYDPREEMPPPVLKKGILRIEDLQPGMELKGTVLNVVDFGAFVDVGLKDSGLVHISQMANRYIKSPYDVVAVHDVVTVWVLTVDKDRHRVSLTMINPSSERERRAPERRPGPRREEAGRPPRGPRPGGPQGQPQGQREGQREGVRQGQDQRRPEGAGQGGRGPRPPRGRHPQGPPGRGPGPRGPHGPQQGEHVGGEGRTGPPPRPPLPPRKPRREPPKPKLSQAALEGKVPLRTFSELSALFAAKKEEPKPAEAVPPTAPTAPAATTAPAPPAPAQAEAVENPSPTPPAPSPESAKPTAESSDTPAQPPSQTSSPEQGGT